MAIVGVIAGEWPGDAAGVTDGEGFSVCGVNRSGGMTIRGKLSVEGRVSAWGVAMTAVCVGGVALLFETGVAAGSTANGRACDFLCCAGAGVVRAGAGLKPGKLIALRRLSPSRRNLFEAGSADGTATGGDVILVRL